MSWLLGADGPTQGSRRFAPPWKDLFRDTCVSGGAESIGRTVRPLTLRLDRTNVGSMWAARLNGRRSDPKVRTVRQSLSNLSRDVLSLSARDLWMANDLPLWRRQSVGAITVDSNTYLFDCSIFSNPNPFNLNHTEIMHQILLDLSPFILILLLTLSSSSLSDSYTFFQLFFWKISFMNRVAIQWNNYSKKNWLV